MDLGRGAIQFAQYTRLKPWDHAAGVLIHHEAGGFNRLRRDCSPYRAEPRIVEETLLLAPDEATWRTLDEMLG
jgi:fructose-1,6-bisphosphatase/inositol monophosphatase family enzyme